MTGHGPGRQAIPGAPVRPLPDAPLVVVTADQGSGKTTLLRQWFREAGADGDRSAIWLALDDADDDADHFRARLESQLRPQARPLTVFLDDFGVIRSGQIRRWLVELVERGRGSARFVVAQRPGVGLPVTRLRPDDLVAELGDDELRLDVEHLDRLAAERELSLTTRGRSELLTATEGWAFGVITVLDRLRSARPEGDDRAIALAVNELANAMVRIIESTVGGDEFDLLVSTSILEVLEPGLYRYVAGPGTSVELDRLAEVAPFLTRVVGTSDRYRLHGLARSGLRDLLMAREHPEGIATRYRSAVDWLEASGEIEAALDACLDAGQAERAADLLAVAWSSDPSAVGEREIERIDAAGATDYVPHLITTGLVSDRSGLERAIDRLAEARWVGPLPHGFATFDSAVLAVKARLQAPWLSVSLERAVEIIARDEGSSVEPQSLLSRSRAVSGLYLLGRFDEARAHAESLLVGHRAVGGRTMADRIAAVRASDLLALLEHDLGDAVEARRHLQRGDDLAADNDVTLAEVAPTVATGRDLARAVVGSDPVEVRIATLTRLIGEGFGWRQLHAATELVRILDRERRAGEAIEVLNRTEDLIGDDEVPPLLSQRLVLLGRSLRPRAGGPRPSFDITPGERSVLYLLADSRLDQSEISVRLDLSINTVKSHVGRIYQKFGVTGRAEAVAHAAGRGLLVTVLPWGRPEGPD